MSSGEDIELRDLAYPYALDAVAELERRGIERRLSEADEATAAEFATLVRDIREVLAAMTVVDSLEPPAELEDSLLRALDEQRAAPPERRSVSRRRRWLAAAAAAVVVAAGAGVTVVVVNRSADREEGVTAQVVREQPDVRTRTVPVATGGTLTVYTSERLAAASVSFEDVSDPAPGRAYQLWLVPTDGSPRSAGVIATATAGAPAVIPHYDSVDTLAMTIEPAGGSPQPTTQPIAAVGLA